jgi:hypothetical protein
VPRVIIEELYEALIEAGASESQAKAAARAIADYDRRFSGLEKIWPVCLSRREASSARMLTGNLLNWGGMWTSNSPM